VICKTKLFVFVVIAMLLFSSIVTFASAQYVTEKTTDVTFTHGGTFSATESSVGVSYSIQGTPDATGTVTAAIYGGNPQADASIPDGISLTKFIAISFGISADDFSQATITITYTDSDVKDLQSPYAIYKYVSSTNSYVELPSTVDSAAKTITVTLTSVDDPLLAVGGTTATSNAGVPAVTWVIVIVSVVVIILVVVFVFSRLRRSGSEDSEYAFES
jgi:hypothetical protein